MCCTYDKTSNLTFSFITKCLALNLILLNKMHFKFIYLFTILYYSIIAQKINLETLNNYSEFLNYGDKKTVKSERNHLENSIFKSKIDVIGKIFKTNIDSLKLSNNLDVLFLVDASSSVGEFNFKSELKFVKKLLSDVTVDYNHTRVALITFSSPNNVVSLWHFI